METLSSFTRGLFIGFVVTSPVALAIWLGRVISLDRNISSARRKHFGELAALSGHDQELVLHAADRRAFSRWRFLIPPLAYAAVLSSSIAAGRALREMKILPDSIWAAVGATGIIFVFGTWVVRRVEVHRLRPFIRYEIEKLECGLSKAKSTSEAN